jgi:hypothetical protein
VTRRDIETPTTDERGYETHPAWGMIGAFRTQSTPGSVLYDSDIRHMNTVHIRLATGQRKRDLHRDWHGIDREFVEVELSEAQWASFVSSMGSGNGVPCTIRRREGDLLVPGMPFESRLAESMSEVRNAAEDAAAEVAAAFKTYSEHKTARNLRHLQAMIENMPANVEFAAKSLTEHAENVVQKSKADIEAAVVAHAKTLGVEASALGVAGLLSAPEDE